MHELTDIQQVIKYILLQRAAAAIGHDEINKLLVEIDAQELQNVGMNAFRHCVDLIFHEFFGHDEQIRVLIGLFNEVLFYRDLLVCAAFATLVHAALG